jgi:hypothetical protein
MAAEKGSAGVLDEPRLRMAFSATVMSTGIVRTKETAVLLGESQHPRYA